MSIPDKKPKKTPFYDIHKKCGAKMITFGEWEMPVYYSSVIDEHLTVRGKVGIFDTSHMGEINIRGEGAIKFLQNVLVGDVSKINDGDVYYSMLCIETGGIIDDLLVYRFSHDYFMLCVNASNIEKDLKWIISHKSKDVEITDMSQETAMLAVQGKYSEQLLNKICNLDISTIGYYTFKTVTIAGQMTIISRTGYTGEDGFELFFNNKIANAMWDKIVTEGEKYGIKPIGLGARDTLRLEMKYALYGNDLTEKTTPIEAGLTWTIDFNKKEFIGKELLLKQKKEGIKRKLIGFEMVERGIPRAHYKIFTDNICIGEVSSGTHSPSLKKGIGVGYVDMDYTAPGTKIEIEVRKHKIAAIVVKTPFYKSCIKKK